MAYRLWERIDRELYEQRLTQKELVERSGIPANTINRLKTITRAPETRVIDALADALGIERQEAAVLAGRIAPPTDSTISVRDAILASAEYTDAEKRTLLGVVDALDAAHHARLGQVSGGQPDEARRAV